MKSDDEIDIDSSSDEDKNDKKDMDYRPTITKAARKRKRYNRNISERVELSRQTEHANMSLDYLNQNPLTPLIAHEANTETNSNINELNTERISPTTSAASYSLTDRVITELDDNDYGPAAKISKQSLAEPIMLSKKKELDDIEMHLQPISQIKYKFHLLCLKLQLMHSLDKTLFKSSEKHVVAPKLLKNKENSTSKFVNTSATEESDKEVAKFSFHLGDIQLRFRHINSNYQNFELSNETAIYIYENSGHFRYQTRFEELEYYLLLINPHKSESTWLELVEMNDLNRSLFQLITTKCLYAVFNSFNPHETSGMIELNFEVYLSDKLKNLSLTNDPSENLRAKNSYQMSLLMAKFQSSIFDACYSDKIESDEFITDRLSEVEAKQNNENLFDLVYEIHTKEFKDQFKADLESVESKLIIEKSNLRPLLRPYQINAVRWMLNKENYSFEKLIAKNQSSTKQTLLKEINNIESNKLPVTISNESEHKHLHPLFIKLIDKNSQIIYYHKYLGIFTTQIPLRKESLSGGILADEMGLGKTLEILACILINPRLEYPEPPVYESNDKIKKLNEKTFSCVCGDTPAMFRFKSTYCENKQGSIFSSGNQINQCILCGAWTHVDCVNYKGDKESFLCLNCCTKVPPIVSGCTLIVTPSVISHQWMDEIKKHINKNLKVLFYTGCNNNFIQPADLAKLDICITTYDVLSNELSHVFAIENMRQLRKTKRFMNVPSPLTCVEWWRICLDEAQMVHSTNTRCAEMAGRLHAVNRWCVTGTPIGRSLSDLHGLFTFIREDPYIEKKWFKETLYEPYIRSDKMPMAHAVSKVLWRTAKKYVEDQINIPKQTEKVYWFNFSPFELHLYERVLETFRENRRNNFNNSANQIRNENETSELEISDNVSNYFQLYNKDLKLDEMERTVIDQILAPLIDLRLTCNHPQLVLQKRSFMPQGHKSKKEKLLSMETSLQLLMKKTEKECENMLRIGTMHSNAIAGLQIIKKNFKTAKEIYQKILDAEKNFDFNIKLDLLQKVHSIYNLIYVLQNEPDQNENKKEKENQIDQLNKQLKELENKYTSSFDETKMREEIKFKEKVKEVGKHFAKNLKEYQEWLLNSLVNIEKSSTRSKEFWERLGNEFHVQYTQNNAEHGSGDQTATFSYKIFNKVCTSYSELKLYAINEFENLTKNRKALIEKNSEFFKKEHKPLGITPEMVTQVADCHLRKQIGIQKMNTDNNSKCELCKCETAFREYSRYLYSNLDDAIKIASHREKENESDEEVEYNEMQIAYQKEHRSNSDIEKLNRLLLSFLKNFEDNSIGKKFCDDYASLKEEFKLCRLYWTNVSNMISGYDELDMVKTRMTLMQPNEKNINNLANLVEPDQVDIYLLKNQNDKALSEVDFRKKYGQLIYLKTLMKTNLLGENEENKEQCPICQNNLGYSWFVLACGHSFCNECFIGLGNSDYTYLNLPANNKDKNKKVRCALCRELSTQKEAYHVCTKTNTLQMKKEERKPKLIINDKSYDDYTNNELFNIRIEGNCNSAKVEGIVKCLIKILREDSKAKCIVFSEHVKMLELIQDLLKDNLIDFKLIKDNISFQKNIQEFKKNPNINVLLMPYTYGANGLNIIEATHVLLVEPTLNRSQEQQAIGRVHRIGQTKETVVYRFVIRNTVEELVYNLFNNNDSYSKTKPIIDQMQPNCSAAIAAAESNINDDDYTRFKERKVIKICDLQKLFNTL